MEGAYSVTQKTEKPAEYLFKIPNAQFGLMSCSGEDSAKFLQGQLTCDILKLAPGVASLAAACTAQGRAISIFHIFYERAPIGIENLHQDQHANQIASDTSADPQLAEINDLKTLKAHEFFFLLPLDNLENTLAHLKKYSVFSKVTLVEKSLKDYSLVIDSSQSQPAYDWVQLSPTHSNEYQAYLAPNNSLANIENEPLQTGSFDLWHRSWLNKGLLWPSYAISGQYIPQDIGLDLLAGVSFNKGCYTGQEPIARLHFRGKTKFGIFKVTAFDKLPEVSTEFKDQASNRIIGKLIDVTSEPPYIGLARLRLDANPAETKDQIFIAEQDAPLKIEKIAYTEIVS